MLTDESTSSTLLREVADWGNHQAWVRFRDAYDPRLRRWCRGYGLDGEAVDEVCRRIWWELALRMQAFEYDPSGSFRGWLGQLCKSRVINYLRERRDRRHLSLDGHEAESTTAGRSVDGFPCHPFDNSEQDGVDDPVRRRFLDACEQVQSAVRARVKPHNWDAFWLVAVYDWNVAQTAEALSISRISVYAAKKRVERMLREEGRRLSKPRETGG